MESLMTAIIVSGVVLYLTKIVERYIKIRVLKDEWDLAYWYAILEVRAMQQIGKLENLSSETKKERVFVLVTLFIKANLRLEIDNVEIDRIVEAAYWHETS